MRPQADSLGPRAPSISCGLKGRESALDRAAGRCWSRRRWLRHRSPLFASFFWQAGFGAFSVSQSQVEEVRASSAINVSITGSSRSKRSCVRSSRPTRWNLTNATCGIEGLAALQAAGGVVPVDPGNRPAASSLGSDLPALRAGKRSHLRRGVREACRSSEGRAAAGTLRAGARRALAAAQLIASPAQVAAIPAWVAAGGVGRLAPRRRGLPPRRGGLRSRRGWLRLSRPGPRRLPLKRFLQPAIFR